jgi:hypothetical protein
MTRGTRRNYLRPNDSLADTRRPEQWHQDTNTNNTRIPTQKYQKHHNIEEDFTRRLFLLRIYTKPRNTVLSLNTGESSEMPGQLQYIHHPHPAEWR